MVELSIDKDGNAVATVTIGALGLRNMYEKELKAGHPKVVIQRDLQRRLIHRVIEQLGNSARALDKAEHELTAETKADVPKAKIQE